MEIRVAVVGDCGACYELSKVKELLTVSGEPIPLGYFKEIIGEGTVFLVAESGGKVIGYITASILPGKLALGMLLAVEPEFQNQGIGKKLMAAAESELRSRGVKWVLGYVPKFSEKTIAFHKGLGYTFGEDMVEMLKELKDED